MFDRSRRAYRFIAAEHDERRKAALMRTLSVREAELEAVLGRQERHDALARYVGAEIRDQMAQVIFFLGADGAVGEKYVGALARQTPYRVIRVDPRVHALARRELSARRTQLRREHRLAGTESGQKIGNGHV